MKKLTIFLLFVISAFFAIPAHAATREDRIAIKTYHYELKKLPAGKAPADKVAELVKTLVTLDPKKASIYYKLGLKKLAASDANKNAAGTLMAELIKIIKASGLSNSQIKLIEKQIEKATSLFQVATPLAPYVDDTQSDDREATEALDITLKEESASS
jgi:hypothetical protein